MENTLCNWAVCYDIDGSNYDDHQTRTAIAAIFRYPHDAENFIEKCTPKETRSRFYVKRFCRKEEQNMNERRYQVVTWSSDIGSDEHMDYNDAAAAIAEAQRYKGREEYAAVYDRQTKTAVVVFGDPFTPVFCEYVTIKRRPHK